MLDIPQVLRETGASGRPDAGSWQTGRDDLFDVRSTERMSIRI